MTKRGWSFDSLVLIFSIIVVAQLLAYVIPQGEFARQPYEGNPDRPMVVTRNLPDFPRRGLLTAANAFLISTPLALTNPEC